MMCRVKGKEKRKIPTHPNLKNLKILKQRKGKGKERGKLVNPRVWTMIQTLRWLRVSRVRVGEVRRGKERLRKLQRRKRLRKGNKLNW